MSDEELIEFLRTSTSAAFNKTAADRIEALVKERDDAVNQLDSARHSVDVLEKRVAHFMSRAERLEAALKWQAEQPEAHPFMVAQARAALKGADHE